jgi:hypothetical protein
MTELSVSYIKKTDCVPTFLFEKLCKIPVRYGLDPGTFPRSDPDQE